MALRVRALLRVAGDAAGAERERTNTPIAVSEEHLPRRAGQPDWCTAVEMGSKLNVGGCGIMSAVIVVKVSAEQRRELDRIVSRPSEVAGLGPTCACGKRSC